MKNDNEIDMYKRYFVFSQRQYDMRTEVETKKLGKKPNFGTVVVNGSPKVFTEIVRDMKNYRFSDAIVLISGDIRKIKYNEPQ